MNISIFGPLVCEQCGALVDDTPSQRELGFGMPHHEAWHDEQASNMLNTLNVARQRP